MWWSGGINKNEETKRRLFFSLIHTFDSYSALSSSIWFWTSYSAGSSSSESPKTSRISGAECKSWVSSFSWLGDLTTIPKHKGVINLWEIKVVTVHQVTMKKKRGISESIILLYWKWYLELFIFFTEKNSDINKK